MQRTDMHRVMSMRALLQTGVLFLESHHHSWQLGSSTLLGGERRGRQMSLCLWLQGQSSCSWPGQASGCSEGKRASPSGPQKAGRKRGRERGCGYLVGHGIPTARADAGLIFSPSDQTN